VPAKSKKQNESLMGAISGSIRPKIKTKHGIAVRADSVKFMRDHVLDQSVDLIMTSPPFGLVRKKEYGNVDADSYTEWFRPFAQQFKRILKPQGSLVIDIGGAWKKGTPTKSLYQYELLIDLCKTFKFHLAQEFFWWNPSKLPTPAEWTNVRRIRVKDAVNNIWWLSPTPYPKANNRRVLSPYSSSMDHLLKSGYKAKLRPSGHDISEKFSRNNGAAIPPNLLAVPNTESNSKYLRYCEEQGLTPHPARFPSAIPEFFVQYLTDKEDVVLDPFAGSCVTGEVAESLKRNWICIDMENQYLKGAKGRFTDVGKEKASGTSKRSYEIARPGLLWTDELDEIPLPSDGGRKRPVKPKPVVDDQTD
jgi:DNA modification methylase